MASLRAGNARNTSGTGGPMMWRTPDAVFAIMVTRDWRVLICKLERATGVWTTFDAATLGAALDWNVPYSNGSIIADSHRTFSIAVDWEGHVIAIGGLHNNRAQVLRSVNPGDITSWTISTIDSPTSGLVNTYTYPKLLSFSDGELWLAMTQYDPGQTPAHNARDSIVLKNLVGTTTWVPVFGTGDFMVIEATDPNPAGTDIPVANKRAYLYQGTVGPDDSVHYWGTWRFGLDLNNGGALYQNDIFYVRSFDRGATFENVYGGPVTLPLRWLDGTTPYTLDVEGARVPNDQIPPYNGSGLILSPEGHPHLTWTGANLQKHAWWDGTDWNLETIPVPPGGGYWAGPANIQWHEGEMWTVGAHSDGMVKAWNRDTDMVVRLAANPEDFTVPDGVQDFADGPGWLTSPADHAGELPAFFLPVGNRPAIRQIATRVPHKAAL